MAKPLGETANSRRGGTDGAPAAASDEAARRRAASSGSREPRASRLAPSMASLVGFIAARALSTCPPRRARRARDSVPSHSPRPLIVTLMSFRSRRGKRRRLGVPLRSGMVSPMVTGAICGMVTVPGCSIVGLAPRGRSLIESNRPLRHREPRARLSDRHNRKRPWASRWRDRG